MAKHGFKLENTGGNCTAFIRNDGQIEEIVTRWNDPSHPTKLSEKVIIGTYEIGTDGEPINNDDMATGYTFGDVLKALDNPSEEYFLLDQRLYNNFHK
jgi:hypothetical protein